VADVNVADDIVQDVLLKVQSHIDRLPAEDRLPAWILRLARNAIVDHYRARAVRVHDDIDAVTFAEPAAEEEPLRVVRQLAACVARMIEKLPPPDREALELTNLRGLNQRELAERCGISLSGAKSRVQRARQRLQAMVLECCRVERDARGAVIDYVPTDRALQSCARCGACNDECE
jgi:RNA polymerase sigma-70 factor (ECF subfamily)